MRIAVYGGAGAVGTRIVAEALDRDHAVTVVTRSRADHLPLGAIERPGDAADGDDVARGAAEHDVMVSAIGPSRAGGRPEIFLRALRTLTQNVAPRRLIVVGGAGPLFVAPNLRLMDTTGFPAEYLQEALAHLAALEQLKAGGGFDEWIYVSPAPVTGPGRRTGRYRIGSDSLLGDAISFEDFAVAVVDEIERPKHRRQQICVSS